MLHDLAERTGIVVHDYEIIKINFLRDVANTRIIYSIPGKRQEGAMTSPIRP